MKEEFSIIVDNVSLSYKTRTGLFSTFEHKALNNVSFSVKKGEVFGVLGKNGAGKSSLLRLLAGVLSPDSGRIYLPPGCTRSLLSLGVGFDPSLSGRDNAIISCMYNGYSKRESLNMLPSIKEFSELGHFFDQPIRTYSSGMKSRLGFATGIISHVDILLIDEVLSVGDKHFKGKAEKALLDKINGDQTVIFVSHNEEQIKKLCHRAYDLSQNQEIILEE